MDGKEFKTNFTTYYTDCKSVISNLDDKDAGFYVNFDNGAYTYIQIEFEQKLFDCESKLCFKAFAKDNFSNRRFVIFYDYKGQTADIEAEYIQKEV